MTMNLFKHPKTRLAARFGAGLIVFALLAFLFGGKSLGGFALGFGGLLLVYGGFRLFWEWLEKRYSD